MHDDSRIEERIAEVLRGSGLPMERRAEVAEEMRDHLEQAIASKREAGRSDPEAVELALADFGLPQAIRKQLRRQQRMLDRRHAWDKLRRQFRWIVVGCAVLGAALAILSPERVSFLNRCLGGVCVSAWWVCVWCLSVRFGTPLECQLERRRPRDEYDFLESMLRWTMVGALSLSGIIAVALVLIAACTPLLHRSPLSAQFVQLFWYNFGIAWFESAARNFGLAGLVVLGFALGAALYERSRCVEGGPSLAEG